MAVGAILMALDERVCSVDTPFPLFSLPECIYDRLDGMAWRPQVMN